MKSSKLRIIASRPRPSRPSCLCSFTTPIVSIPKTDHFSCYPCVYEVSHLFKSFANPSPTTHWTHAARWRRLIAPLTVFVSVTPQSQPSLEWECSMKGVVFLGERQLEIRDFPDPEPGPRDVV